MATIGKGRTRATPCHDMVEASKISNDNMRKMVEWSTEATRTETEYLDKKIDHSLKINTIYLHHIAKNTQPKEEERTAKSQICKLQASQCV